MQEMVIITGREINKCMFELNISATYLDEINF